jgi:hypothetical protein
MGISTHFAVFIARAHCSKRLGAPHGWGSFVSLLNQTESIVEKRIKRAHGSAPGSA